MTTFATVVEAGLIDVASWRSRSAGPRETADEPSCGPMPCAVASGHDLSKDGSPAPTTDSPGEEKLPLRDNVFPAASSATLRDRSRPVRILIADDHRIVRAGLAGLLGSRPELDVVGLASDGEEAVEFAGRLRPDVVVMDVTMPRLNGIEATRVLQRNCPSIRIVGLSMHDSPEMADAMREAGAAAYVTKGGPPEELIAAIIGD